MAYEPGRWPDGPAPASPVAIIRRQRLIAQLQQSAQRRLTMVVAPAGYGKTTLARDFLAAGAEGERPLRACWVTFAPADADGGQVLRSVITALRTRLPDGGRRTLRLLDADGGGAGPPDRQRLTAAAGALAEELHEASAALTLLILDDYHLVDGDASARMVIEALLRGCPGDLHWLLLSRIVPALDTSSLVLNDDLAALGPRDLAFTREELAMVLRQRFGMEPDPALLDDLHRATEGWIAGVILAMPLPFAGGPASLISSLRATLAAAASEQPRLHEYLAGQLLERLASEDQQFLLAAALPDHCDPAELDQVLERGDSAAVLARLERLGFPVTPMEGGGNRYRMHALLQQFLRARLRAVDPRRHALLRQRWGAIAEARGDDAAALSQYLAGGQQGEVIRLLERAGERWIDLGRVGLVEDALSHLPATALPRHPRLGLCAARLAISKGRHALAVEQARQAGFAARRRRDSVSLARSRVLEAISEVASGRPEEAQALCLQALEQGGARRYKPLLAEMYRTLGLAEGIQGQLELALGHMERALELYEHAGRLWDAAVLLNNLGVVHEQLGQAEQARRCHTRSLALRRELGDLAGTGTSLNNLGLLHFYQGDYAEADALFREAVALAERLANPSQQAAVQVNLGDLRRAQQRLDDALSWYRAAQGTARRASDPRWRGYALLGEAAAQGQLGDLTASEQAARQALALAEREGLQEVTGHARAALAAIALDAGRRREAAALIDSARRTVEATRSKPLQVRVYLWAGAVAFHQRHWGEALACVQVAAEAAVALGGAGLVAAEGPALLPLLRLAATRQVATDLVTRALDDLDPTAAAAVREVTAPAPAMVAELPSVRLRLCGSFRVAVGGRATEAEVPARSRVRELLAYLAVHPEGRRREEIGADLWPDAEPGQEATLTYTTLHRLRQALFPELIASEGLASGVYRINPRLRLDVDVLHFERLLRAAHLPTLRPAQRRALLVEAVAAYGGDFLPECAAEWAAAVRQRLTRRAGDALAQLADYDWATGDYRSCLTWCERLLDTGLAEASIHLRAMQCHERLGQPLAGILLYRRYLQELEDQEGTPPATEATAIYERLQVASSAVHR